MAEPVSVSKDTLLILRLGSGALGLIDFGLALQCIDSGRTFPGWTLPVLGWILLFSGCYWLYMAIWGK